ncbi:MAG: hypothetical protein ACE5EZ_05720, partial [Thermodesulfobacteriota bacterium]
HWGFQYYMEAYGARPFDRRQPRIRSGDIVVKSYNNSNISDMPEILFYVTLLEVINNPLPRSLAVMSFPPGAAGFYSSIFGALPYALGYTESDRYSVIRLKKRKAVQWPGAPGL